MKRFMFTALAALSVVSTASAADLGMKDGWNETATVVHNDTAGTVDWWIGAYGGAGFTRGTSKGTVQIDSSTKDFSTPANGAFINHHWYSAPTGTTFSSTGVTTFTPDNTTPRVINGTTATSVTVTCTTATTCTGVVSGQGKAHLSFAGAIAETRGGVYFNLGNGWGAGPAFGVGYSAQSDDVTYSAALELRKRWGNAQLAIGAGYLGEHTASTPFSGASFSQDVGGFMGLAHADLAVSKNTALTLLVEEVAVGSFNTSGNGYSYKTDEWDTRILGGLTFHTN